MNKTYTYEVKPVLYDSEIKIQIITGTVQGGIYCELFKFPTPILCTV